MNQEDKNILEQYNVIAEGSNSHGYNQGKGPDGKDAPHWKKYRKKLEGDPGFKQVQKKFQDEYDREKKKKKKKEGVEETDDYQDRAFQAGQNFKGPMFSPNPDDGNYDEVTRLLDELIEKEMDFGSPSEKAAIASLMAKLQEREAARYQRAVGLDPNLTSDDKHYSIDQQTM